jgi:Tol biopolymer transport system component
MNRHCRRILILTAAAALWLAFVPAATAQSQDRAAVALKAAIDKEVVDGDLKGAIEQYKKIAAQPGAGRATVATALLRMGQCYEKLGNAEARTAYERLVRDFGDQAQIVAQARVRLAALGGPAGAKGPVARRLLADASALRGLLTADGKIIRWMDRATGDMVQFEIASGQTSRIANKGLWNKAEEFLGGIYSRDGRLFAYGVNTKDDNYELRLRNLDGTGLRALPPFEKAFTNVELCDYSPDGSSILAVRGTPNQATELALVSTADGSVRVLKKMASAWFMLWPASFSPDGRRIAFSFVRAGDRPHGEVFVMGADGQNEVAVAGHPAEDLLLAWTPDGKGLVFLSNRSGTWDIWTVRINGGKQQGEPELLKKDFGYDLDVLGFSPDGFLYYKTETQFGGLYSGEVDIETGKVLVPPAPLTTRYTGMPWGPQWSPDGQSLLYLSRSGGLGVGNNILTIRSAATGEERFLSPGLRYVNQFSWSLDGRSVVTLGWSERKTGLFRIDADTSALTELPVEAWAGRGLNPRLGPDGKTLVFVAEGPSIRRRNLDTGEESEVVKKIDSVLYDLSPDGREVVFQVDGALKIVSVNGGEPRELYRGASPYHRPRWTKDGRYIIAEALGTASSEIWRIPVQGGAPLKLDLSIPKLGWFALHPDNRRFAFSTNEGSRSELWVLENFLPPPKVVK